MHTPRHPLNQSGIVSMMVAIVLMAVMTLIVLGFAELSRNDQRQTLDRQLSSQAFYAAETGVNDAQHVIETALNNGQLLAPRQRCQGNDVYVPNYGTSNVLSRGVDYTCLLVDTTPNSLLYTLYPGDTAKVFPIESASSQPIHSIKLQWTPSVNASSTPRNSCPTGSSYTQLPPVAGWGCGYGVLRVDLVPINARNVTTADRNSLLANTFTAFFVPTTSGSTSTNTPFNGNNLYGGVSNQGSIVGAGCQNTKSGQCTMIINIQPTNSSTFYMRLSTMYLDTSVSIFAYTGTSGSGSQLNLKDAQALVDATGQAQDVLRRIQVRIPISNNGGLRSDYAIQTTNSICKEFTTYPGFAQDASGQCPLP